MTLTFAIRRNENQRTFPLGSEEMTGDHEPQPLDRTVPELRQVTRQACDFPI